MEKLQSTIPKGPPLFSTAWHGHQRAPRTSAAKLCPLIPNHLWGVRGGIAIARARAGIPRAVNALRRLTRLTLLAIRHSNRAAIATDANKALSSARRVLQNNESEQYDEPIGLAARMLTTSPSFRYVNITVSVVTRVKIYALCKNYTCLVARSV